MFDSLFFSLPTSRLPLHLTGKSGLGEKGPVSSSYLSQAPPSTVSSERKRSSVCVRVCMCVCVRGGVVEGGGGQITRSAPGGRWLLGVVFSGHM